ncbi:MAG: nitronate monooxygenase [Opitutaceae bacterium]|jgi:NAD(P)H-dependent flavin oxidoreductase YrpB (nitropropane dioxygenase family)|nr:nitronate monooxygenase [Opitutaceae bacterium]
MANPIIIQGGMGVAVSGWRLAKAVAQAGQLGVVSGTALASVFVRQLQQGDPAGHLARAIAQFPLPALAARVWQQYYIPGGKVATAPFKLSPLPALHPGSALTELTVLANFTEVFLAKEGHSGRVGINFLEKIQMPTLASVYGAMLAQVDYILMGAGIPRSIPGVLDHFARGEPAELKIEILGAALEDDCLSHFDPRTLFEGPAPALPRPQFLAIISSATLALTLARKSNGRVDGFIVEGAVAGGHNAPPRGALQLSPQGEPIYGPRDIPELAKIREIGLPFWLAGAYAQPEKLAAAQELGAAGVQLGTVFAFCEESGVAHQLKNQILQLCRSEPLRVFTDPLASPTGFPFKVLQLLGTLSEEAHYFARKRICDLGYLRQPFRKPDGAIGYRCAGEPADDYVQKGGKREDTIGRKCLCNGLMATVGLGQERAGGTEDPIITAGDDVANLARFLPANRDSYGAAEVIRWLLRQPLPA